MENKKDISNSSDFINKFMEKLENGELKRENEPEYGKKVALNDEFIKRQRSQYKKMLDSKILDDIEKEEHLTLNLTRR